MASKNTMAKPSLIEALGQATEEDLAALRERVVELEQARDRLIDERNREIESIRAAAKLIDVRLHGKPARAPRRSRSADSQAQTPAEERAEDGGDSMRCKIFDLIAKHGTMTIVELANSLRVSKQVIAMTVAKSNWFRRAGDEVSNA